MRRIIVIVFRVYISSLRRTVLRRRGRGRLRSEFVAAPPLITYLLVVCKFFLFLAYHSDLSRSWFTVHPVSCVSPALVIISVTVATLDKDISGAPSPACKEGQCSSFELFSVFGRPKFLREGSVLHLNYFVFLAGPSSE